MKKTLLLAMIPLAVAGCATAGDADHAHAGGKPARDAGMQMSMMQDNMLVMHEQMHRIIETSDPAERARLRKEHQESMQQHMRMMRGMDPGAMGDPMMGTPGGK